MSGDSQIYRVSDEQLRLLVQEEVANQSAHALRHVALFLPFILLTGFCLVGVGAVRTHNLGHLLTLYLITTITVAGSWYAAGHAFALGGRDCLLGSSGFFNHNLLDQEDAGFSWSSSMGEGVLGWMWSWAVCLGCMCIVGGSLAERVNLDLYAIFCVLFATLLFPLLARSSWSPHGLFSGVENCSGSGIRQVVDFAGAGVMHLTGGTAGFTGTCMIGPRSKRALQAGDKVAVVWTGVGSLVLWGGLCSVAVAAAAATSSSSSSQSADQLTARVAIHTSLAALASACTALVIARLRWGGGMVEVESMVLRCLLCGAVAASCSLGGVDEEDTHTALIIGLMAGAGCCSLQHLIQTYTSVDDLVGALCVHAWGGLVGILAAGVVDRDPSNQFGPQCLFAVWVTSLSSGFTLLALATLDALGRALGLGGLRVSRMQELQGLSDADEAGITSMMGSFYIEDREVTFTVQQYEGHFPMEDRVCVLADHDANLEDHCIFGLYDGHLGHQCAEFLAENLHQVVFQCLEENPLDVKAALQEAFVQVDQNWRDSVHDRFLEGEFNLAMTGSCALVVLFHVGQIHIAQVGNSRAYLGTLGMMGDVELLELTGNHTTENLFETTRLTLDHTEEGEEVLEGATDSRVKGQLKLTRSIGDLFLKEATFNNHPLPIMWRIPHPYHPPYISSNPEVVTKDLESADRYMLLVSEGLMEFISDEDIQNVMNEAVSISEMKNEDVSGLLIRMALERAADKADMPLAELMSLEKMDRVGLHGDMSVVLISFLADDVKIFAETRASQSSILRTADSVLVKNRDNSRVIDRRKLHCESLTAPELNETSFILVTDIQDSTALWERDSDIMYKALMLHRKSVRNLLSECGGYEMYTEGDAFFAVFHSAHSMLDFAMRLQEDHLRVEWPEGLDECVNTLVKAREISTNQARCKSEKLDIQFMLGESLQESDIWRGLRIRVAMHCGRSMSREISAGRVIVNGPAMDLCKDLIDIVPSGGQVVCTEAVMAQLSDKRISSLSVVSLGRARISEKCSGTELFSVMPRMLLKRQFEFLPLKPFEKLTLPALDCPPCSDNTVLTFCSISQLKQIQHHVSQHRFEASTIQSMSDRNSITEKRNQSGGPENDSDELDSSLRNMFSLFSRTVEESVLQSSGYIVETKPGFFLLAFEDVIPAIKWATEVQVRMMNQPWSKEILDVHCCREVKFKDLGVSKLLFRGPRVKIGMYVGNLQAVSLHRKTGRAQYFGPGINAAARVTALANGGQSLIAFGGAEDVQAVLDQVEDLLEGVSHYDRGFIHMKGVAGMKRIVQFHRNQLMSRKFNPIRRRSGIAVPPTSNPRGVSTPRTPRISSSHRGPRVSSGNTLNTMHTFSRKSEGRQVGRQGSGPRSNVNFGDGGVESERSAVEKPEISVKTTRRHLRGKRRYRSFYL